MFKFKFKFLARIHICTVTTITLMSGGLGQGIQRHFRPPGTRTGQKP